MRVALINGICAKHDAISNAVVAEYGYLQDKFGPEGVKFYGYALDYTNWNHKIVKSSAEILSDEYFLQADLVIFHFGIYYELFNTLLTGNGRAKQLVCFHNVTPKALLGAYHHEIIDNSLKQQHNLFFADHTYCDSIFNKDCLSAIGLPLDKLSVMGLPVEVPDNYNLKLNSDGCVRLLFIGRIVPSKGVLELLTALQLCIRSGVLNFELKIVGNFRFSDEFYVEDVRTVLRIDPELANRVELVGEVDDSVKYGMLMRADAFVLPTHHEGFCVPIVEALAAGCFVISYNNSNVPNVTGAFGILIATGDINALSETISELCRDWDKCEREGIEPILRSGKHLWPRSEFINEAKKWAKQFSQSSHKERFLDLIRLNLPNA